MKKNWDREDDIFNEDEEKLYKNVESEIDIFDDDDEEIDNIKEQKMLETLDSDLLKYFSEARVVKKKNNFNKKTKKEKNIFTAGEKVKFNNKNGCIIYGPYEKDDKIFYEIETTHGIISVEDKGNNIQKI
jgi:hypothetical protein